MTLVVDWLTKAFFDEIQAWARETFPDQTPERVMEHLQEEHQELAEAFSEWSPGAQALVAPEIADCMILLIVLADELGIDVLDCLKRKHELNLTRKPRFHPELGYDKMDG